MVDTYHWVFVKTYIVYTPRGKPNANYGLWMTMVCQGKAHQWQQMYHSVGNWIGMEDAVHVWGQEVYGNLSLAMNIKLPYKIKFINLKNTQVWPYS
jgi:hypothetical protein